MSYNLLPTEEPGKPLMKVPPGFTDQLMQRIADRRRREKRRRRMTFALVATCLVASTAGIYQWSTRQAAGVQKVDLARKQPGPVTAQRQAAPVMPAIGPAIPQTAPTRNAVKRAAPSRLRTGHDNPVARASAANRPEDILITVDGKAYRCTPGIMRGSDNRGSQVEQVSDGKRPKYTAQIPPGLTGPCRAVPSPGQ